MKKTLLLLVALITATIAFAYDAKIDGIYYDFDHENMTATVTHDGDILFNNGAGYTQSEIFIPQKVTYNGAVYSVTSVGYQAFRDCKNIHSITIPNSVNTINTSFYGCSSLTSISIPENVTSISSGTFTGCSSLTSIEWNAKKCDDFDQSPFKYINTITSFVFGNNVEHIPAYLCDGLGKLIEIVLPNSVTSIGSYAFSRCSSLTSITIPNGVTSIGSYAFDYTPWFNNQPNGCVYIGKCLYTYKGEIQENTIINIKEGITTICYKAFYHCDNLTSIRISSSVTLIELDAFGWCEKLSSIIIEATNPPTLKSGVFSHSGNPVIYIPDNTLEAYKNIWGDKYNFTFINNENTLSINVETQGTLSDKIFDAGYRPAFVAKLTVTGTLNKDDFTCMRETMTSLVDVDLSGITNTTGVNFEDKSNLMKILLPENLTSIESSAFSSCSSLTSIIIPNSVTSILNDAFSYCSLTSITCLGSIPPKASDLGANAKTCTLIVPKEAYNSYLRHAYWGQFLTICKIGDKEVKTTVNNSAWGTVTGAGIYNVNDNEVATLTAIPNEGYRFVKWSDEVTENPRTIVVTQDSTFTAIFEANTFVITTAVNDDTMGSVTEGGEYAYGTEIVLTATANEGYSFAQWSDGNTDNPRIITVTENKTYTAEFEVETFTITTASEVPSMGGVKVILVAEPIEGFEFVEWTDGNTDNPRILTLTENIEVYARFQIAQGGNPVDLENSKISSANIYTTNGTLHIEGATENYHILDAAGRLIYSGNASTLTLPRGIYLVTINGEVEKIVL